MSASLVCTIWSFDLWFFVDMMLVGDVFFRVVVPF